MYIDLWGWFDDYEQMAIQEADWRKQRLPRLAFQGWRNLNLVEPDHALQTFTEGLQLAQAMQEPAWELFFDLWCCEVLVYHKNDLQVALDRTIRTATRAYQPRYAPYPVIRSQVYFVLANLYYMIDPLGYETEIRDLLTYIEREVPMALDTHLRIMSLRSSFEFEHERYDASRTLTLEYLALAEGNWRRMGGAYERLSAIAYAEGDISLALEYSRQHELFAGRIHEIEDVALSYLRQAIFLVRLGETGKGYAMYQHGLSNYAQYEFVRRSTYYDSICEFLELTGDSAQALSLREQQQTEMLSHHSIAHVSLAYLQYCRLLGRMKKPLEEALSKAHALSEKMRRPEIYLERLERIRNGDFHLYQWQG